MKLTKQALKQIIKEELDAVMEDSVIEEGSMTMAYYNQSMIGVQVELQYDGKSVDFQYRYAGRFAENIKRAIESLANKKGMTIGSMPNLTSTANIQECSWFANFRTNQKHAGYLWIMNEAYQERDC